MQEPMSVDGDCPLSPDAVYVRSVADEPKLTVKLNYRSPEGEVRAFNFLREKTEPWEKFSQRIARNIRSGLGRKKKKGKKRKMEEEEEAGSSETRIALLTPTNEPVQAEVCADKALEQENVLCIGEARYRVRRNAPSITGVRLAKQLLLHCPVSAEMETEFCDAATCKCTWSVHRGTDGDPPSADADGWTPILAGAAVTLSSPDLLGQWVKLTVVPCDAEGQACGLALSQVSRSPVGEGPTERSPIRARLSATQEPAGPGSVRIVTYNLLADFYADSDHSRDYLYPYCPPAFLDASYRRQVALWELAGYRGDLLCLQEVDEACFHKCLLPILGVRGFEGRLLLKQTTPEGMAIFYRADRLQLVENCSLPSISRALFDLSDDAEMGPTAEAVKRNVKFSQRWDALRQGLLGLVLRWREDDGAEEPRLLLVATTHLYFHPNADHLRLLQATVCLKHLGRVRARLGRRCGMVWAGDLNSDPRNAVFEMATCGRLRTTASDWYSCGREEFFGNPAISLDLALHSAYDPAEVEATNYVAGFRGVLDYIFFDPSAFRLLRTIPLPPMDALRAQVALPNEFFPSDHIALVADFQLL